MSSKINLHALKKQYLTPNVILPKLEIKKPGMLLKAKKAQQENSL